MKTISSKLLSSAILFILSFAQVLSAQETQVPFCNDIMVIEAKMGANVSRFMNYKDFQQATLVKSADGLYLNVVFKANGVFQFEKVPITETELEQLCQEIKVSSSLDKEVYEENFSQEARRRLILASTSFSLGYYSWAIPRTFKSDDYKTYTASYMLIGGASFFIPLYATRDNPVTNSMTQGYAMGAINGFVHGLALQMMLWGDDGNFEQILGFTSAFSIAESLIGLSIAKKNDYSWGKSSLLGSAGLWGAAAGAALPLIILDSDEVRLYGLTMLAGSVGGIIGANYLYNKQPTTHGDATIINTLGALGGYWGATFGETFNIDNERVSVGLALATASAGLTYGFYKTKGYDYSRQQGNLASLGGFAGGLIGAGIGVLVEAEETGYLWLTALGATGGFFLSDYVMKEVRKEKNLGASNLSFQLNPMGLMGAANSKYLPKTNDPRVGNTIANLSYTF
jgi:hypothetical protein